MAPQRSTKANQSPHPHILHHLLPSARLFQASVTVFVYRARLLLDHQLHLLWVLLRSPSPRQFVGPSSSSLSARSQTPTSTTSSGSTSHSESTTSSGSTKVSASSTGQSSASTVLPDWRRTFLLVVCVVVGSIVGTTLVL